jgi:HPt (histidine-containing phosphotransfer) domain-containing protein
MEPDGASAGLFPPSPPFRSSPPRAAESSAAYLTQSLSVLDRETFEGLEAFLPPEQLAELYREFLRLTCQRLELLRGRIPLETLRAVAHTLAGTAGMLGAQQIANLARQLDLTAADQSFDSAHLVGLLFDACDTLKLTLSTYKVRL